MEKNDDGDLDHQMKKMRVEGMQSQMEKNKVDCIMTQIDLMERMRDVYVRNMGREKYEARIVHLMNTMPGMEQDVPGDLVGTSIAAPSPATANTAGQQSDMMDHSNHDYNHRNKCC